MGPVSLSHGQTARAPLGAHGHARWGTFWKPFTSGPQSRLLFQSRFAGRPHYHYDQGGSPGHLHLSCIWLH